MLDQPAHSAGFHLHHGNRLEGLVQVLAQELCAASTDPLTPDVLLVPHPGMAQWLKMRLADALGVAANLTFPLPGIWFGRMAATGVDPADAMAWSRDALTWRINALREAGLGPLSPVSDRTDRDHLARWQLATQVAQLFDRYQLQRADWLRAWANGRRPIGEDSEHWQARLWQRLIDTATDGQRRALMQRLLPAPSAMVPDRVFAFGFASLPASYLDHLQSMATRIPVHLFFTNPCRWYWGDLLSEREQLSRSRKLAFKPALDAEAEGHPLLAGYGAVGRDFLRQLYAGEAAFASETEQFEPARGSSVLAQIQNGILSLEADALDWPEGDSSIRLIVAPNRRRELEALHDLLLELLDDRALDLRPHDIAVMVPKLSDYAPMIDAVFGGQPRERRIAWQVTDLAETERHPLADLFLKLIDLPTWRFGLSEVLDALARPAFAAAFHIAADELPRLAFLLEDAGARWGLDGSFRARLDAGDEEAYTFRFAIDRLVTGWMMGEHVPFDGVVAPYAALRASDADLIGRFVVCLDRLDAWRARLARDQSLSVWRMRLGELRQACFAESADEDDNGALLRLMRAIDNWSERTAIAPSLVVPRRVVHESLAETLHSTAVSALPGEGVNLCAMVPLRGLPFRVIVLLGLGEGEFPRREREQPDDLCRRRPRPGDRSVIAEDRYLFLEAITSARDVLVLSYVDQDPETGQPRGPSPVLAEFHDYLRDAAFGGEENSVVERIEHVARFPGDPRHFGASAVERFVPSHATEWRASSPPASPSRSLAPALPHSWEQLCSLFIDPARTQLRWRGVDFGDHGEPAVDDEPFALDSLRAYQAREVIVEILSARDDVVPDEVEHRLAASALLPPGRAGRRAFRQAWSEAIRVRDGHVQARGERMLRAVDGTVMIGQVALPVRIDDADTAGLLRLTAGKLNARRRMKAWLDLLALGLLRGDAGLTAIIVGLDGQRVLEMPADIQTIADRLMSVWHRARIAPMPLYPATSAAYAESAVRGDIEKAQAKASMQWNGSGFGGSPGESLDPACAELARCFSRWDAPPFADLAIDVYGPLFAGSDQ